MKIQDKEEFGKTMFQVGELYEKSMTPTLLELYFNILKDFTIEQIKSAIVEHVRDKKRGQYFPKPADIIFSIEGDDEVRALKAWDWVKKAIHHHGYPATIIFDDPVIHMCIERMGGWIPLSLILADETPFKERTFVRLYLQYLHHPEECPAKLVGTIEAENRDKFPDRVPEPIKIITGIRQTMLPESLRKGITKGGEYGKDKSSPADD